MIYKPKGFQLQELIPKLEYENYSQIYSENQLWGIFDNRALWTLEQLKRRYNTTILNDYLWGGINQYRGWRPSDCKIGALLSQHKFARAFDCKFKDYPAEEVRENIKKRPFDEAFKHITCVEDGTSWLHFDCRGWDTQRYGLLIVTP